jgi:hypothetical protein
MRPYGHDVVLSHNRHFDTSAHGIQDGGALVAVTLLSIRMEFV